MDSRSNQAWTIAWRTPRANRFHRATNWTGTWSQAVNMAQAFNQAHPDQQVFYVTTAALEADQAARIAAGTLDASYAEDHGNILMDSGRRVRMVDNGTVDAELVAQTYCGKCTGGRMIGVSPTKCTDCDGTGRVAAVTPAFPTMAETVPARVLAEQQATQSELSPAMVRALDNPDHADVRTLEALVKRGLVEKVGRYGYRVIATATATESADDPACPGGQWCRCPKSTPCYPGHADDECELGRAYAASAEQTAATVAAARMVAMHGVTDLTTIADRLGA